MGVTVIYILIYENNNPIVLMISTRHFKDLTECLNNSSEKCNQTEDLIAFLYPPYYSIGKLCIAPTPIPEEQTISTFGGDPATVITTSGDQMTLRTTSGHQMTVMTTYEDLTTEISDRNAELTTADITEPLESTSSGTDESTEEISEDDHTTTKQPGKGYSINRSENLHGDEKNDGPVESTEVEEHASYYPTDIFCK